MNHTICGPCAAFRECSICHRKLRYIHFLENAQTCTNCDRNRLTQIGGGPSHLSSSRRALPSQSGTTPLPLSIQTVDITAQQGESVRSALMNNQAEVEQYLHQQLAEHR